MAMDYEALIEAGGMIGHGGVVLFDDPLIWLNRHALPWTSY